MSIQKIPINRATISKIVYPIFYCVRIEFPVSLINLFHENDIKYIDTYEEISIYCRTFTDKVPKYLIDFILRNKENVKFEIESSSNDVSTKEINQNTKYSYLYHNDTKVTCKFCGEVSRYCDLEQSDCDIDPDTDICPKCEEPECCSIEYEYLSDEQIDQLILTNEITIK